MHGVDSRVYTASILTDFNKYIKTFFLCVQTSQFCPVSAEQWLRKHTIAGRKGQHFCYFSSFSSPNTPLSRDP